MSQDTSQEKSESPTKFRIQQAQSKGIKIYSIELNSFIILCFSFIVLFLYKNKILLIFTHILINSLVFNHSILYKSDIFLYMILYQLKKICLFFLILFICIFLIILMISLFLNRFFFKIQLIKFNFLRLDILNNLKTIFCSQLFPKLLKIILKLLIICLITVIYFKVFFFRICYLSFMNPIVCFHTMFLIFFVFFLFILIGLIPAIIFDVFYQNYNYYQKLNMSKQEIIEEYKAREGNTQFKKYIQQVKSTQSMNHRMIQDVPKSNIIITDALQYSVAIQYDLNNKTIPIIVAKGIGRTATEINKMAFQNNILVISSHDLAQLLYKFGYIGQIIPTNLHIMVSEILVWVKKIMKWKIKGGTFPFFKKNISILSKLKDFNEY